jgi:hypothetical protein
LEPRRAEADPLRRRSRHRFTTSMSVRSIDLTLWQQVRSMARL